jgi:hypothetical protein
VRRLPRAVHGRRDVDLSGGPRPGAQRIRSSGELKMTRSWARGKRGQAGAREDALTVE